MSCPVISLDLSPPSENEDSFLQYVNTARPISPPLFTSTPITEVNEHMGVGSQQYMSWHDSWNAQHHCPDPTYENISMNSPESSPDPKTKDVEVQTGISVADVGTQTASRTGCLREDNMILELESLTAYSTYLEAELTRLGYDFR